MNATRFDPKFSAVLKSITGKTLEIGAARVYPEQQAIEFYSEFVPLFRMGTPLQIIQVKNELEIQAFRGEVYLSSANLLQLVSLTDEVLPGAQAAFLYDTKLDGCIRGRHLAEPPKRKFFELPHRRLLHPTEQMLPVEVHAISTAQVKFDCSAKLAQDQQVTLTLPGPPHIAAEPVVVEQAVIFGDSGRYTYRCRFLHLQPQTRTGLEPFVGRLAQLELKMFPPVLTEASSTAP